MDNLHDSEDIIRSWENNEEDIQVSSNDSLVCMNADSINCGLMKNVHNFRGSRLKVQWLQDPNKSNVNNLNTVRGEDGKHVGEKREYLKAKIKEPERNNKNKNIRDLYKSIND